MDILERDIKLKQIRSEIRKNKTHLLEQFAELETIKDGNKFLTNVHDDYKNYANYIKGIKKEQEIQILRLLHYLEKNMLEANLTEKMTREAMHEQKILLEKLDSVRSELKDITQTISQ